MDASPPVLGGGSGSGTATPDGVGGAALRDAAGAPLGEVVLRAVLAAATGWRKGDPDDANPWEDYCTK